MFKTISKTGVGVAGLIATAIIIVGDIFGIDIAEDVAESVAGNILALVSFGLTIWGQFTRRDLQAGLFRKEPE